MFTGTVKIADLSDFISPSQACVVKLDGSKVEKEDDRDSGLVGLNARAPRRQPGLGPVSAQGGRDAGPVKITLHDCLACSGCITSAETILLEQQSAGEVWARLRDPDSVVVFTVSPQSAASLAAHYGVSLPSAFLRITAFLRSAGARHVLDSAAAREVSLIESAVEFVDRCRDALRRASGAEAGPPAPTQLPLLASACPGWVCFAEKQHGGYILPHISAVKSPQAVMGTFVKGHLSQRMGYDPRRVHHVAVMPCYDKKLEAAREDFREDGVAGTDTVLTTAELHGMMAEAGAAFLALPDDASQLGLPGSPDRLMSMFDDQGRMLGYPGGSGGYLECVYRHAARELYGLSVGPGPLPSTPVRGTDFREVTLGGGGEGGGGGRSGEGRPMLRFAYAYGFKSIQGVVRRVKRGQPGYDYVEVMACPSGCLNGAGQMGAGGGAGTVQERLDALDRVYHGPEVVPRDPWESPTVRALYAEWIQDQPGSARAKALLHTAYHAREQSAAAKLSDW